MLPTSARLTQATFTIFFKNGKRRRGNYLTLITHPSPTFHGAVVVSKKVYKKAVDRNQLRRQLYAVLYRYKAVPGVYIVVVSPKAATASRTALRAELETLIQDHLDIHR